MVSSFCTFTFKRVSSKWDRLYCQDTECYTYSSPLMVNHSYLFIIILIVSINR